MRISIPNEIRKYINDNKQTLSPPAFIIRCLWYIINNNIDVNKIINSQPTQRGEYEISEEVEPR